MTVGTNNPWSILANSNNLLLENNKNQNKKKKNTTNTNKNAKKEETTPVINFATIARRNKDKCEEKTSKVQVEVEKKEEKKGYNDNVSYSSDYDDETSLTSFEKEMMKIDQLTCGSEISTEEYNDYHDAYLDENNWENTPMTNYPVPMRFT